MDMTYNEAMAVIRQHVQDEQNWRGAMAKLPELFQSAMRAQSQVEAFEKTKADLEADIERCKAEYLPHKEALDGLKKQIATFSENLMARERDAGKRLGAIEGEIKAKQEQLHSINEAISKLKTTHA